MKRLVDGAFALVAQAPFPHTLGMLDGSRTTTVKDAELTELLALALGIADDDDAGPLFRRLEGTGWAAGGLPPHDAAAMAQLERLGRGYRWMLPASRQVETLLELMRRAHSQRKLTHREFGQTPVLPECGVARCLEATRRVGIRKRFLLIGDDDLHAPVLAAMGHDVTVLEIDPALVAFIQRLARQEDLHITARVQDVRDPLPPSWLGSFDVLVTDPISYHPCLLAFLGRGMDALRPGGLVLCALHPYARDVFKAVWTQLPLELVDHLAGFNAYHDEGFTASWYKSDLLILERGTGPGPFPADQRIPLDDLIGGAHAGRWHGWSRLRGSPFRKPQAAEVEAVVRAWSTRAALAITGFHAHTSTSHAHLYFSLDGGGHLALSLELAKGELTYALYPYGPTWDVGLKAMLGAALRMVSSDNDRLEVPPLDAPTLVPTRAAALRGAGRRP